MLIESWLLLHAAELAEHAATQLAVAASTIHDQAHAFVEEITRGPHDFDIWINGVDGGCHEPF